MDGHFTVVEIEDCRQLLGDASIGRVTWNSVEGLQTLPVAYGVGTDGRIGFRVSPTSILAELAVSSGVLFEVDDVDAVTATGWSVLVRGRSAAWVGEFPDGMARPWAPGDRPLALQITPESYSGRSVSAD